MERKFGKDSNISGACKKLGRFGLGALARAKSVSQTVGDIFTVDMTHAMSSSLERNTASVPVIDATPHEVQEVVATKMVDTTPTQLVDSELDETRDGTLVVEADDRHPRSNRAVQIATEGIESGRDWGAPYRERPTKRERIRKRLPDLPQLPRKKSRYVGVPHRERWSLRPENHKKVRILQLGGVAAATVVTTAAAGAVIGGASIHNTNFESHTHTATSSDEYTATDDSNYSKQLDKSLDIRDSQRSNEVAQGVNIVPEWSTVEVSAGDSVWELSEQQLVAMGNAEPTVGEVSNLVYYTIGRNDLNENGDISVGDTLMFPTNIGS